jgi:hypothetical protein
MGHSFLPKSVSSPTLPACLSLLPPLVPTMPTEAIERYRGMAGRVDGAEARCAVVTLFAPVDMILFLH